MKKSTPPLIKHQEHRVEIRPTATKHPAQYWCLDCNKHIAWLSKQEAEFAEKNGLISEMF